MNSALPTPRDFPGYVTRGHASLTSPLVIAIFLASLGAMAAAPAGEEALKMPTRLAVDAAHSWLIPPDKLEAGAALIAQAGMHCARERMSWGETEPRRGVFQWGKYDRSADAARAHGIQVCQVFHNLAGWARADGAVNRYPDDLRDAYNFCREAARHFHGRVQTWEVWNEADIREFSLETADAYAAFLKASYLGFKHGDPEVQVALVSLAMGAGRFEEALFQNDAAPYMDIFNYHIYDRPAQYPARAQGHFDLMDRYRLPRVPVWLTEAGIGLKAVEGELTEADRQRQAEFIPKSYVMSLASSTDRHFFFVFPHFIENGVEFGALDAGMKPYPGYHALAGVTKMLGQAVYLGRAKLPGTPGIEAHLFDHGEGQTLVLWHEGGVTPISLPAAVAGAPRFDFLGRPQAAATGSLEVGPAPCYLRLAQGTLTGEGTPLAARRNFGKVTAPAKVVIRAVLPDGLVAKDLEAYQLKTGEDIVLKVETYNFGDRPAAGHVKIEAPLGWSVQPAAFEAPLAAMGRELTAVTLRRSLPFTRDGLRRETIRLSLTTEGGETGTASLDTTWSLESFKPEIRQPLTLAPAETWSTNISGNGSLSVSGSPETGCVFEARFDRPGDRWLYPTANFTAPRDWTRFDGLELETRIDPMESGTVPRVMLVEPSGATYHTAYGFKSGADWKRAVIMFEDLSPGSFAPPDPKGKLDLSQIASLRIGCNTGKDHVKLQVRNVALVRFAR